VATTPTYGWPYQGLFDPPDGPNLGANLAVAVEGTVSGVDGRVAALEAVGVYRDSIVTVGTVGSVTFSGIPSTLRLVRIDYTARGDTAAHTVDVYCRINGDAGANYNHALLFSVNAGAPSAGNGIAGTSGQVGTCMAASATAGKYGGGRVAFPGWNSPHSACLIGQGDAGAVSAIANSVVVMAQFQYLAAGPYTSITLMPQAGNFIIGSGFYLEGLR